MNEQKLIDQMIDLETKFSFQESLLEELRQTTHAQYLQIEQLEKTVKNLTDRMKGLGDDSIKTAHEKPPHY